jgi:hypothetical protein
MGPTKKTVLKSTSAPFSSQQQKEKQHNTRAVAAAAALPATSSTKKDTRAAVVHHTTAASMEEPWMTRFTMSNFMELHQKLYNIIQDIVDENQGNFAQLPYDEEQFLQRWIFLMSKFNPNQLIPSMTWNQIEVCLNIKELAQYKDFILSCPGINKKIRLIINRGAFELGMNKVIKKEYTPNQESQDEEDNNTTVESNTELILTDQSSDSSTDSNVKNKESDYGGTTLCVNDNDPFSIRPLLRVILPIWRMFIQQHPQDIYA